ncbi:uncharacterized protein L201_006474 [Kwoniella dendrophila CBS 6074]|uniref:RNA polymerase II subunit A C-terminal domain phosphatase n=1 Tax=Kwoniella dendrophila CBS 6074 TaxID=1295534 RepID=A0AAX4K451_9TREE
MSDPPTQLSLPSILPYPITITRLLVKPGDSVKRGSNLLEYSFMSKEQKDLILKREKQGKKAEFEGNDGSGTWDCLIEGEVNSWENWVKVGITVERRQSNQPLLNVSQPCSHPVQLHGMCGICGADLTEDDYLSVPAPASSSNQAGPSRHAGGFEVTHDSMGVTVSKNEAHRLDNLTRDTLLSSRKLSLIVDLDQTIIHTTVDPTVAEWMNEIESYNNSQIKVQSHSEPILPENPEEAEKDERSTTPPLSPSLEEKSTMTTTPPTSPHTSNLSLPALSPSPTSSPQQSIKEKNPNAEALKDVAKFQIADDLPPGYVQPRRKPGQKPVEIQGRWYFTKPRPGLQKFLDEMSALYEMHVYTMGTRSYADAICKAIDPQGKIFGGRILSRDESGSFSSKNLKRLFPTDTSMVVVIDDRSDVWADCPNLVKVVPYDFFLGIGDINSSFLPKNKSSPPPSSTASASASTPTSSTPTSPVSDISTPPPATPDDLPSVEDGLLLKAKLLDDLSESRPLAKMQEELEQDLPLEVKSSDVVDDGHEEPKQDASDQEPKAVSTTDSVEETKDEGRPAVSQLPIPPSPYKPRKPLLNPNDYELLRVSDILTEIHDRFYRAYDSLDSWDSKTALPMSCDVEFIIPELKSKVLEGCNLVFSGLIPQAVNPETAEIWQTAETFGALCSLSIHPRITHCVTATLNTEKTYKASKIPGVKTVWANWFWDSVALWNRQDEDKYIAAKKIDNTPSQSQSRSNTPPLPPSQSITSGPEKNGVKESDVEPSSSLPLKPNESEVVNGNSEKEDREDMDDDEEVGQGWDEGADAEWEAFLAEDDDDDDFRTENGSVKSVDSVPSTPSKKRVRYADEESLPLEDYKDPSPQDPDDHTVKRRKPFLLEAPTDSDQIPDANRFQYKSKGKQKLEDNHVEPQIESDEYKKEQDTDDHSIAGTEGTEATEEDEFAMMLMDSLADGDTEGNVEEEFSEI